MEQMLRNRIAEQEETLRQRKAAKKQRRGVATESLSDMSPFYGILTTVGQLCQLLGIIWWLQAMHAGDSVHSSRLAPAAALRLAKVAWGLVDSAIRGQAAALKQEVGAVLSPSVAIAEQCLPVLASAIAVYIAWILHSIPEELGYARLEAALGADESPEERAERAAAILVASVGVGVLLALLAIVAPTMLQHAGFLRNAWPADPVPGMERQHAASLAEKAAQRQLQMRLGQDGLCPSGNAALYGAARASRLCCLALSEELLYRSVLYGWLGMLSEDFRSAEPSAALSLPLALGPAAFSALLFGATFTSYHGEWAVGLSLGVLLQAWAVATSSLLPTVVAHATMELILDGYRRRRPLPKPVRTALPAQSLNLVACAD